MDEDVNEPQEQLTPEQQQVQEALTRARTALGGAASTGILGMIFRGFLQSMFRFPRIRMRKLALFGFGLLILVLSIATCSAGVDLANLTAEYGNPVPATKSAARRLVERIAAAIQNAPAGRRIQLTMSDAEATSALSLGLMISELPRAMRTVSPERIEEADDIEELREMLRRAEATGSESRTFKERIAAILDPQIRTGDVQVRFTAAGEIVVAGYVQAWRWQQPAMVVFRPRAQSGELELDFVKGKLGRLPAPEWAFDLLGRLVSSLILVGRDYAEISNLTVEAGRLTFAAGVTR